ncbi:hypothetical protein MKQ70_23580 [Chitinophaga sedimenti]|uniref:hypothetical protein n=1 Tax=Chitinophaga sedimenti TaxID=2033606 RepID=UPI002006B800|nr:hypothetical protein [Chitinophaga sedimenti]MCK7557824.1 hypothetical protein [Chitinophaga sedimenti]
MTFPLGLFRFLTIFNLVVLGLFAVIFVASLPATGVSALFGILLLTPALLHQRRCLVLQRHFRQPGLPVNAALPMAINLSSIGAFIWAILVLWEVANFFRTDPAMFQTFINNTVNSAPDPEQKAMMQRIAYPTMRAGAIFLAFTA